MTRRRFALLAGCGLAGATLLLVLAEKSLHSPTVVTSQTTSNHHVWIAPLSDGRLAIVEGRDLPGLEWLGVSVRESQRRDLLHILAASADMPIESTYAEGGFAIECSAAHHHPDLVLHVSKERLEACGHYRRELTTGREILFFPGWLEAAAYSPDDEFLAATDPSVSVGHTVIVFRRDGTLIARYPIHGRRSWTWSHSQRTLAVNSTRYDVDLIDVPSGASRRLSVFTGDPTQSCYHLTPSPDDQQLAALLGTDSLYTLAIFDLGTGRLLRQFQVVDCGYQGGVDWSPAGLCYVAPVADPWLGQLMLDREGSAAVPIDVPRRYLQVRWLDAHRIVTVDLNSARDRRWVGTTVRLHEWNDMGNWSTRTVFKTPP